MSESSTNIPQPQEGTHYSMGVLAAIRMGQKTANELKHAQLEPLHLLLGIMKAGMGVASAPLTSLPEDARNELNERISKLSAKLVNASKRIPSHLIGASTATVGAFQIASDRAKELKHGLHAPDSTANLLGKANFVPSIQVDSDDLLWGLIKSDESIKNLLQEAGITEELLVNEEKQANMNHLSRTHLGDIDKD